MVWLDWGVWRPEASRRPGGPTASSRDDRRLVLSWGWTNAGQVPAATTLTSPDGSRGRVVPAPPPSARAHLPRTSGTHEHRAHLFGHGPCRASSLVRRAVRHRDQDGSSGNKYGPRGRMCAPETANDVVSTVAVDYPDIYVGPVRCKGETTPWTWYPTTSCDPATGSAPTWSASRSSPRRGNPTTKGWSGQVGAGRLRRDDLRGERVCDAGPRWGIGSTRVQCCRWSRPSTLER